MASSKQSAPFLCQCSIQAGEDWNPNNHSSKEKMVLFDARQWYRSRPVILGFLSSILFQTTALLVVLTDEHNERKRQIADVLMTTPLRCAAIFFYPLLAVFIPVFFCSRLARWRWRETLLQCCSMVRASASFWGTFSVGMVLNLGLASWLGLIEAPLEITMLVFESFSVTLGLWGLAASWEALLTVWDEENADTDMIFTFVC
jgi:hypothetical protein